MNIHEGHRQRMKSRFLEHGADNFGDHELLELLLYYALPRSDTNPVAHELLLRFGSLTGVLEASADELKKVPGMGESSALLLKLSAQVTKRALMSEGGLNDILSSSHEAGNYLVPRYLLETDEIVYAVCLDSKCKVLCCRELCRGTVNSAELNVRRLVELALGQKAVSVILAHNHTSGIAIPSPEDKAATLRIRSALRLVGIELTDHIVVAGEDFVSMADSGLL